MLHIHLLGSFHIANDERPLVGFHLPRLQALFSYLLLFSNAPQSRHHLAFLFWPDSSEKQAHTNLRKLLFQLRNALPDPERFLLQDHLTVQWRSDAPHTVDVVELHQLLAQSQPRNEPENLARIAQLYQGELLPGCFDEWLLPIRQQLQQAVMSALEQLINLHEHQREYQAGIRYAQRLLGIDPLHEAAYRRVMQLHALNGERAAALHTYQTCAALLQRELGVEPDAETHALYQRLLAQESPAAQTSSKPLFDTPLIGRTGEWQTLLTAWRQSQRGQAHFVSIAGEAGIGKTRLAEEMLGWASSQGFRVARTRSYEAEGGLAYAPVTEWLRSPLIKITLAKLDKVWLSEIARLLPELLSEQANLAAPAPLGEAWQRQRFFEALARAILLDKSPLLLVIDDLQWCDSETLTWLRFLLRFDARAKLLIIGTWRSEAVGTAHPLSTLLRDLGNANQLTALELTALNAGETTELAQQIATRQIAAPEMQHLYIVTEGHPLFIIETVRSRSDNGAQTLPLKVQNVIQARLAQLSSEARDLAGLAATIGRKFSLTVIRHASQCPEETLVRSLDELWQRRIVRETGTDDYDFTHDRIREVAYQLLSHVRRRLLHRRVAEALEAVYALNLEMVFGQLAYHYETAHMAELAFHYWVRSAQHAETLDAYVEAAAYYERGLQLHDAQLPHDAEGRFTLLLLRSAMFERQGQTQKFASDNAMLLELAVRIGSPVRRAQAQLRQACYLASIGKHLAALQAGELALASYQASANKPGEMQTLRDLSLLCWSARDYGNALRYGREVLQLHRQQSDINGEASALHNLAEIHRGLDSPRQAINLYEQALQLYWGSKDQRREVLTLYSLAYAYRQTGQIESALTCYRQAIAQCAQIGDRLILSRVYHALATLDWERQQPEAALQQMEQAVAISQAISYLPGMVHGLVALAYMNACMDRQENAHRQLTAALVPLRLMDNQEGIGEVERRLQLLASAAADMPAPPIHMNWVRTHIVLTEGKVYCEFESSIAGQAA